MRERDICLYTNKSAVVNKRKINMNEAGKYLVTTGFKRAIDTNKSCKLPISISFVFKISL